MASSAAPPAADLSVPDIAPAAPESWQKAITPFRTSDAARSVFQYLSTFAALGLAWGAAYAAFLVSPWLALPIDPIIAGIFVRIFILQHDCGHGSFFATERANRLAGYLPGFVMMTPFAAWRSDHAIHHATSGNLDKRGTGDIEMLTVAEYLAATKGRRLAYRLIRNPFVMLIGGPFGVFILGHRFPAFFNKGMSRSDRMGVHVTTLVGLSIWAGLIAAFGWQAFLVIQLPSMLMGASAGIFLFYCQHQYEAPYWQHTKTWSYLDACLYGSSHLKLNRVLAWFSGDIGVHHLHHLAPKIPNYKLRACLAANPQLAARNTLSLWDAVKTLQLKLYDEEKGHMVSFRDVVAT